MPDAGYLQVFLDNNVPGKSAFIKLNICIKKTGFRELGKSFK